MSSKNGKKPMKAKAASRTGKPEKTSGKPSVQMVPQPHGGALQVGNPGNSGGSGRPPSVVRQRSRDGYYTRIPTLEAIADSEKSKDADKIAAVSVLGRMGMTGAVNMDDIRERLRAQLEVIRSRDTWSSADLISAIKPIWRSDT